MTRKTRSVRPVHTSRLLKGTLLSGNWISGIRGTKGLTRSRKRTARSWRVSYVDANVDIAAPLGCAGERTATHNCGLAEGTATLIDGPEDDEDGKRRQLVTLSQRVDENLVRARQARTASADPFPPFLISQVSATVIGNASSTCVTCSHQSSISKS